MIINGTLMCDFNSVKTVFKYHLNAVLMALFHEPTDHKRLLITFELSINSGR